MPPKEFLKCPIPTVKCNGLLSFLSVIYCAVFEIRQYHKKLKCGICYEKIDSKRDSNNCC